MMKELSISESKKIYSSWCETGNFPKLDEYVCPSDISIEFIELRAETLSKYKSLKNEGKSEYELDYRLSVWFYMYLKHQRWFSLRLATTEDFWRYVAMIVIPDVITDRYSKSEKPDARHYYSKGTRVYPYTLYWYTYLSWYKNEESTLAVLSQRGFNTDTIVGLVERTGRNGTPIELYRSIMYNFGELAKIKNINNITFRSVMKLCLAKIAVIDPDLYDGENDKYALSLVSECSKNASLREQN